MSFANTHYDIAVGRWNMFVVLLSGKNVKSVCNVRKTK